MQVISQCGNCLALKIKKGDSFEWNKYPFVSKQVTGISGDYCPKCSPLVFKRVSAEMEKREGRGL